MAEAAIQLRKKPGFADKLKATAKPQEAKAKKKEMPKVKPDDQTIRKAVDDYKEADAIVKQGEAVREQAGDTIMLFIREVADEEAYKGNYHGSWAVLGDRHTVKVVYANKYSITPNDELELREILGEHYDNLITESHTVKLRDEVFKDELLQNELMELLGDRWDDFFDTIVKYKVNDNFSQALYQFLEPDQLEHLRAYAKQNRPSLR